MKAFISLMALAAVLVGCSKESTVLVFEDQGIRIELTEEGQKRITRPDLGEMSSFTIKTKPGEEGHTLILDAWLIPHEGPYEKEEERNRIETNEAMVLEEPGVRLGLDEAGLEKLKNKVVTLGGKNPDGEHVTIMLRDLTNNPTPFTDPDEVIFDDPAGDVPPITIPE